MSSRRAAVLGSPISHSRSPALHRAAYSALGLDWTYDAIEVTTETLPDFLAQCHWPDWAGLSLTMPLKSDVLPYLDDVSDVAELVRAANTIVIGEDGLHGHNTDVAGMRRAVEEACGGPVEARSAIVIGSGATARSAVAACGDLGVEDITVVARSPHRTRDVIELGERLGMRVVVGDWDGTEALDAHVVVSTLPPGAADHLAARIPESPGVLLDVAYGEGPTALTRAWSERYGDCADGLDLLLWQAVDQVGLMTGLEPPVEAMRAAVRGAESGRP